jgi:hypothetical protein
MDISILDSTLAIVFPAAGKKIDLGTEIRVVNAVCYDNRFINQRSDYGHQF